MEFFSKKMLLALLCFFSLKVSSVSLTVTTYNDISKPAKFIGFTKITHLSSNEITNLLTPIIKKHLEDRNYDRMYMVEQFLDFYDKNKQLYESPIKSLAAFDAKKHYANKENGMCFGLTQGLLDQLPSCLTAYKVGAILTARYQQNGWPLFPHVAIIIPYANPVDSSDKGYIFVDANFDIGFPIVLKQNSAPVSVDMGTRGTWKFHLRENKVICYIFSGEKQNKETIDAVDDIMVYMLKEYVNSEDASLKAMVASSNKISVVSRDENGTHKAHIQIDLAKEIIFSNIYEEKQKPIFFQDFITGKKEFSPEFAKLINMDTTRLNNSVRKIIKNTSVLKTLSQEYFDLLHEN